MDTPNNISYSEPSIQYLQQVLNMVKSGTLRVPRFQRPFIWLEDRQLELMRSIREGIPIGSIMVWRTTDAPVAYYKKIGNFPISQKDDARPQQYILDGVQRICTLYGALTPWKNLDNDQIDSEENEENSRTVFFSFSENDFIFADAGQKDQKLEDLMPLSVVFESLELIKFQRKLIEQGNEKWVDRSSELAASFRDYKIPLISITTDDLSIATSTFQRINSQGAKMSDLHMIHALTWTDKFDLQNELSSLKEELLNPMQWGAIDDEIILKVCKGLRGLNLYKTDPKEISMLLRKEPDLLRTSVEAICATSDFFLNQFQISRPEFIPYSFQIIFISIAFVKSKNHVEKSRELILLWFWFTTYSEAFSGMADDRVKRALEDFHSMIDLGIPVWSNDKKNFSQIERKDRFDFRSVRSKATVLALLHNLKQIKSNKELESVSQYGREAIQLLQAKGLKSADLNSIGNKILCKPNDIKNFRQCLQFEAFEVMELRANFFEPEDATDLSSDLVAEVIQRRAERIFEYESAFARKTAGYFQNNLEIEL